MKIYNMIIDTIDAKYVRSFKTVEKRQNELKIMYMDMMELKELKIDDLGLTEKDLIYPDTMESIEDGVYITFDESELE